MAEFLDKGYRTDNYIPDTVRAMDTYWFHSHVDLLLSQYDTLDWGDWESKVVLFLIRKIDIKFKERTK